ncbi:MAG: hypothetical protein SVU88_03425 [Candidatus Nanohaloarchaea archaeon]|nr:hypothetical protein [Candidatus Nanohaloarchaea archaeon]
MPEELASFEDDYGYETVLEKHDDEEMPFVIDQESEYADDTVALTEQEARKIAQKLLVETMDESTIIPGRRPFDTLHLQEIEYGVSAEVDEDTVHEFYLRILEEPVKVSSIEEVADGIPAMVRRARGED